jgi:hypothetical protein
MQRSVTPACRCPVLVCGSDYIHGLSTNTVNSGTVRRTRSGGSPTKFTIPERPILTLCRTEGMSKYFPVQYTPFPPRYRKYHCLFKGCQTSPARTSAKKNIMTEISMKCCWMTRKVEMTATQRKKSPSD